MGAVVGAAVGISSSIGSSVVVVVVSENGVVEGWDDGSDVSVKTFEMWKYDEC